MDKMHASMNFSSLKTGHITDTFFIFINNKTQIIQNQCAKVQLFFQIMLFLMNNLFLTQYNAAIVLYCHYTQTAFASMGRVETC
jgi:hypothetical protein